MVAQAGAFGKPAAGAELEGLPDDGKDIVPLSGGGEGAKECATADSTSADADAWHFLIRQMDAGIPGGVLELDVVPWPVFFDQSIFEKQGLDFVVCNYKIQARRGLDQALCLRVMIAFLEVVAHSLLQVLGLSDVEDFSLGVQVKVSDWKVRDGFKVDRVLGAQFFFALPVQHDIFELLISMKLCLSQFF